MSNGRKGIVDRTYLRVVIAVGAVAVAFALRQSIVHYVGINLPPYITFYPAVILIALFAGFWPAVFATVLASMLTAYWIFPPIGSFAMADTSQVVTWSLFASMGILMSLVADRHRRSQQQVTAYKEEQAVRASQEKLRQSEEQFETLANAMPQLSWIANADGWHYWYNQRWYEYTGKTPAQMEGWGWQSVHDPAQLPMVLERWRESIETGKPFDMVVPLLGSDGLFRPFLTLVMPLKDANGNVIRWFGTNTDISAQKSAEEEVRKTRDLLESFIENAPAGLAMFDHEMRYVRASKQWRLDTGLPPGEINGKSHYELFPEMPERWKEEHRRGLAGEIVKGGDEWKALDGTTHSIVWTIHPWGTSVTNPDGIIIFSQDITESKRAEEALSLNEERLRLAQRAANMGTFDVELPSGKRTWSQEMFEIFGVAADGTEPSSELVLRRCHPDDRSLVEEHYSLMAAGKDYQGERRIIRPDGEVRWIEVFGKGILDDAGHPIRCVGIARDITDRKRAEETLRESQSRLDGIVRSAMDSIISVDEEQRIVLFNESAEKVFDCPRLDALGSSLDRFIPHAHRDVHREHLSRFGTSGSTKRSMYSPVTLKALRANGEEFPIEATISQIEEAGRKYFTVILRDISERRRAEDENSRLQMQLLQGQKLEAIGRLAGNVAHDFNTLLTIILGYAELLLSDLPEGDPRRERVKQIHMSGEMGALLTKQLLAFSRRQPVIPRSIDLCKTVADLEPILRRLLREDIELKTNGSTKVCPVKADPGQIEQLLLNLTANARDAMPHGGNLTVEIKAVDLDETYVHHHLSLEPGKYIMLAVSDTGEGMEAEVAAHIFEPFFTTKSTGQGTGLGLSTVYGIVKQCGGDIWVYSEPGIGTVFRIYLPQSSEAISKPSVKHEPKHRGNTETILVVDDSKPLRELAQTVLSLAGYRVLEAGDGIEALEVAKRYEGKIHVLITDVVMPGMQGTELAVQIVQQRPETAIMFVSGYSEEAMSHIPGASLITILEKPYTIDLLLSRVRQTLDDLQNVP
jgi:PAS domain S-box-containing protein